MLLPLDCAAFSAAVGPLRPLLLRVPPSSLLDFAKVNIAVSGASLLSKVGSENGWLNDRTLSSFVLSTALRSMFPLSALSNDVFENLAWTLFLQSSLVLSILGDQRKESNDRIRKKSYGTSSLLSILVAFSIGAFGSFLGGVVGYSLVNQVFARSRLDTITCSSCLTASYIGGTANFFETATLLTANGGSEMSTLTLIAAADVGVMVAYFAVLQAARRFSPLERAVHYVSPPATISDTNYADAETTLPSELALRPLRTGRMQALRYALPLVGGSLLVTKFSLALQRWFRAPGISVAASTLIALTIRYFLFQKRTATAGTVGTVGTVGTAKTMSLSEPFPAADQTVPEPNSCEGSAASAASAWPRNIDNHNDGSIFRSTAKGASEYFLCLFYSVLGLCTRVQDLLRLGAPILLLLVTILSTHLLFLFGGSKAVNSATAAVLSRQNRRKGSGEEKSGALVIDTDTLLLASNACVGGAATSASMAASFGRPDLIFPASCAGILGYLVGTPAGLSLSRILTRNRL